MEHQNAKTVYQQEVQPSKPAPVPTVELILSEDILVLEHRLAQWVGVKHCIAVSDGASALALALRAAGVLPGDQVLCAALGCALPVQGIVLAGATPVFVDVNPNTYTMDPYCLEYALGKLRRMGVPVPAALIATDLFGAPCHYPALEELCLQHRIPLIEDLSGAFGAQLGNAFTGSFGRFAVASFASPSPLEELGGAAVFCHSEQDARHLRALRRIRQQQVLGEPNIPRMGSVDAFLINSQLEDCARQMEQKRTIAATCRAALGNNLRMQQVIRGAKSAYSQLVVAIPLSRDRDLVAKKLREQNIPATAPFCGMQRDRSDWNRVMLVNTLSLTGRLLSLPIHPHLTTHLTEHIANCLLQTMDACIQ